MHKIKLLTDTASDIPQKYQQEIDIDILSFPIAVDGVGYLEGVDFTPKEFIDILLDAKEIPVTSHITSPNFLECYEKYYKEGYTHVIVVPINKKASNTHDAAVMAADMFYEDKMHAREKMSITIIKSYVYSMAYGYPLIQAGLMIKKGESAYKVINYLEDAVDRTEVILALTSLDFAKHSGRISGATAFVGELLGLKPILRLKNGEINTVAKVKGEKAIISGMIKEIRKYKTHELDYPDYFTLEGRDKELANSLTKAAKKEFGKKHRGTFDIGAAILINSGPGIVGLAYYGKGSKEK